MDVAGVGLERRVPDCRPDQLQPVQHVAFDGDAGGVHAEPALGVRPRGARPFQGLGLRGGVERGLPAIEGDPCFPELRSVPSRPLPDALLALPARHQNNCTATGVRRVAARLFS